MRARTKTHTAHRSQVGKSVHAIGSHANAHGSAHDGSAHDGSADRSAELRVEQYGPHKPDWMLARGFRMCDLRAGVHLLPDDYACDRLRARACAALGACESLRAGVLACARV